MASNPDPARITAEMWRLWEEASKIIPGVRLSGIYANKKGYHNTVYVNKMAWPGNYSIKLPLDLVTYNRDKARGIDLTMTEAEMIKWTRRMKNSAENPADFRLAAVREFYGTLDGKTVFGMIKDDLDGPWRRSTADDTHLWHGHTSIFTSFVANWIRLEPLLSVWKGESLTDWVNMGDFLPKQGDSGQSVLYWQQLHNYVRLMVTPSPPVTIAPDGDYGPATTAAVYDFWKKTTSGVGNYDGSYIAAWVAIQYHRLLSERVLKDNPPEIPKGEIPHIDPIQLRVMVNEWMAENVAPSLPTEFAIEGTLKGNLSNVNV